MFCKNCGKQLPDDAVFCTYCGIPLNNNVTSSRGINKKIALLLIVMSIFSAIVLSFALAVVVTNREKAKNVQKNTEVVSNDKDVQITETITAVPREGKKASNEPIPQTQQNTQDNSNMGDVTVVFDNEDLALEQNKSVNPDFAKESKSDSENQTTIKTSSGSTWDMEDGSAYEGPLPDSVFNIIKGKYFAAPNGITINIISTEEMIYTDGEYETTLKVYASERDNDQLTICVYDENDDYENIFTIQYKDNIEDLRIEIGAGGWNHPYPHTTAVAIRVTD